MDISPRDPLVTAPRSQTVVVVNGNPEIMELLETLLESRRYDLVFAEAGQHAYAQIRRTKPDLVVLCIGLDDLDGFQLLSMLKLDPDTRDIQVVTYTLDPADEPEDESADEDEEEVFVALRPRMRLH